MSAAVATIVGAALAAIAGCFAVKASANQQRRNAEADVARETADAEARKEEIRRAVFENDDEALNAIVQKLMED